MADRGGRQVVSGDELRLLAGCASRTSTGVGDVHDRVTSILGGIDRRGWNSAGLDNQWSRTRQGLQELSGQFSLCEGDLTARGLLADSLNSRPRLPLGIPLFPGGEGLPELPELPGLRLGLPSLPLP